LTVDVGRVLLGVPEGVPLGVLLELLTPTREVLWDERGVTLLLRNVFLGVDTSSCEPALGLGVEPTLLRGVRVCVALAEVTEAARRGVMGFFAVLVAVVASAGFNGRAF
jgi:hypothetical protein